MRIQCKFIEWLNSLIVELIGLSLTHQLILISYFHKPSPRSVFYRVSHDPITGCEIYFNGHNHLSFILNAVQKSREYQMHHTSKGKLYLWNLSLSLCTGCNIKYISSCGSCSEKFDKCCSRPWTLLNSVFSSSKSSKAPRCWCVKPSVKLCNY